MRRLAAAAVAAALILPSAGAATLPVVPVALDREQIKTVRAIKREGRQRFRDPRERRRFVNAGIQTGLVEDNLHNSADVRDHDSKNWRQERESGYGDEWARSGGPLNLRASVDRFADEYVQFADPGERSYEIAPQIQRPAAQYRGRYRDVRGQANAIRRDVTLSGRARARGAGGGRARGGGLPGLDAGQAPVGLSLGAQPEALVPSAGLPAPAHSAQVTLPEGFQQTGGQAPAPKLSERMQAGVAGLEEDFGGPVSLGPRAERRRAREAQGRGGVRANTVEGLADELSSWAKEALGLEAGSRDRTPGENAAAGGSPTSAHLEGGGVPKRGREAVDIPTTAAAGGWGQYRKTVRRLGGKPNPSGFSEFQVKIGDRRFKVQVIFGEANGHDDHIHAGFEAVD